MKHLSVLLLLAVTCLTAVAGPGNNPTQTEACLSYEDNALARAPMQLQDAPVVINTEAVPAAENELPEFLTQKPENHSERKVVRGKVKQFVKQKTQDLKAQKNTASNKAIQMNTILLVGIILTVLGFLLFLTGLFISLALFIVGLVILLVGLSLLIVGLVRG